MTEAEWRKCSDPQEMLESLRGKFTERKVRLLNCACCRRIWQLISDQRSRNGVEVAERYAEEAASLDEFRVAADDAFAAYREISAVNVNCDSVTSARYNAAAAAYDAAHHAEFVESDKQPYPDSVLAAARAAAAAQSSWPAVDATDPNLVLNQA